MKYHVPCTVWVYRDELKESSTVKADTEVPRREYQEDSPVEVTDLRWVLEYE